MNAHPLDPPRTSVRSLALLAASVAAASTWGCYAPPSVELRADRVTRLPDGPDRSSRFALDLVLTVDSSIETDVAIDSVELSGKLEASRAPRHLHVPAGRSSQPVSMTASFGTNACPNAPRQPFGGTVTLHLTDQSTLESNSAAVTFALSPEATGDRSFLWSAPIGQDLIAVVPAEDGTVWVQGSSRIHRFGPQGELGSVGGAPDRFAVDVEDDALVFVTRLLPSGDLLLQSIAVSGGLRWEHHIGGAFGAYSSIAVSRGRVALALGASSLTLDGTALPLGGGASTLLFDGANGHFLEALPRALDNAVALPEGGFGAVGGGSVARFDLDGNLLSEIDAPFAYAAAFGADGTIDLVEKQDSGVRLHQFDPQGVERWSLPIGDTQCDLRPTVVALPDGGAWVALGGYMAGVDVRVSPDGSPTTLPNDGQVALLQSGQTIVQVDSSAGTVSAPAL
jgi:hypothetical protein